MPSLQVLAFNHEGRPNQFNTWLDDLQLYLLSDSKESVSLFDLASGAAITPPTTADSATRSQWLTRNAAALLAICNHLPLAECAHFGQHRTAEALYDAVVARYSSSATAALGRLLLPYLFPELPAFAKVEDLVSHLRTSDTRYCATVPAKFLDRNPPPMFITLYFIVTRLPDSLRSVRDHFLSLDPTSLTVDLLEEHLLAAETSAVADVGATSASAKRRINKGKGGRGGGGGSGSGGGGSSGGSGGGGGGRGGGTGGGGGGSGGGGGGSDGSGGSGGVGTGGSRIGAQRGGSGGGQRQQQQRRSETHSPQQLPGWLFQRGTSEVAIFDLDIDVILSTMYALSASAEGDCFRCVRPDPRITVAALGASDSYTLPSTAPAEALHTFTLDSGASRCFFRHSTTLTPLPAPDLVQLADPSGGPVFARSSTVLPCPAVPSSSLTGLHLPLFSTKLVSTAALHDAMVTTTTPGGQRVSICTCTRTGRHLAKFTRRPGSSLYTLATDPTQTLPWHHCLGHPSLPRLRCMHSRPLVSGLPMSLPSLPPSPHPPCLPCVKGRQHAAPHSSSFPPATAPLQTLHMDVTDLSVLRLHSDRGGEFSSDLLRDFCRVEGILQLFMLPASPQKNGIAERRIGLVMEFYHPISHRVLPSEDVTFDESVPFYRLFPYRSAPLPPPPLFLALGPPPVDPLPPQGPAPSGVSQVDPPPGAVPGEVAVDSGAARDTASGGADPGGAKPRGAEPGNAETGGGEPGGAEIGGAEPEGAEIGGSAGALPRLSPQQLRAGLTAGAGVTGSTAATVRGGARNQGTGAAGTGGVGGAGAGDPTESGAAGAGGSDAGGAGAGGSRFGGTSVGGAGAGGARAVDPCGTVRPRQYFVPLLQQSRGLTGRREPASRPASPVRTTRRVPRSRPPPVLGTHAMALRPSSVPLHVPLPAPPESSLPEVPEPESGRARATSPTVFRLLATTVSDPSLESATVSALVAELLDFATTCRIDYATALVAESASASPLSVGGECALGTDILEDRQEDFECLAAAVPHFSSMLLAPKGDPDAPDIPTPRSYAEAITGPYSSQWQAAMDAEMASWKSTSTFVDEVPPPGANIVDGMWIFRPERGDLAAPPTWLHWVVSCRYQWILRRRVYGLREAPHEWHDTLRTTLAPLGSAPSTSDPSLFLRTDISLPSFYVLEYLDDLVFVIAHTEALTLVKSELQKRHTCTDLGELRSYLGLQITLDRARCTITLTQSHMVHQVLQHFGFQFSSPQPTPLSTSHSLSAPPSDESVEPSCPYPELVGCLITSGMGLVLGGRGPVVLTGHTNASWVDNSATQRSSQGYTFSLGSGNVSWRSTRSSRSPPHRSQLHLAYVATRANTADIFTKALPPGDHQRFSTMLGLVPTLPHLLTT
ncbi:unnamed protein product [Closterium sp. NIES-53]